MSQKITIAVEKLCNSLTNVLAVGEDLLLVFCKLLFFYNFVIQTISEKTLRSKDYTYYLGDILI